LLRPELAPLSTYNAGLTLEDVAKRSGGKPIAKLASNENPYAQAKEVTAAIREAMENTHFYPDPHCRQLAVGIARLTGSSPEKVILGDGSEDLLNVLARCLLRHGDEVVTLYPSFPLHEDYAQMMGAKVIRVGLTSDHQEIDVESLLLAVAKPSRLIVFANPMNPAGLWLTSSQLDQVLAAQHPDSVLCVDEAYLEYADGDDFLPATERLGEHQKPLLVLRTFSKAYGLAALRVGYGVSNNAELIRGMNLVRTPFNVNSIAQAAAIAALQHPEAMLESVSTVKVERNRMSNKLRAMGYEVLPSKGNFLFVNGKISSIDLADRLLAEGVLVKPWKQAAYETWFRVSVGLKGENDQFLSVLRKLK
jgi:histidinol-phosphate aminotransferase